MQKNHNSEKEPLYNGFYLRPDAKSYCTVKADEPGKIELCLGNTAEAAQTYICMEPGTLDEASADVVWIGKLSNFVLMFGTYTIMNSSICMQTNFWRDASAQ